MANAIEREKQYAKSEVKENSKLMEAIYPNEDECFARLFSKTGYKRKNNMYPISALKDGDKLYQILKSNGKSEDMMVNLNPFRTMKSTARNNLFCINNIAIDIDYRNIKDFEDLAPESIIILLEMDFFGNAIPAPTYIEYGHQVRLIYAIETCYIPKNRDNVVRLAQRVSEVFAKRLKDYGAEKQNIESYYRLPGSINSKDGSEIHMVMYNDAIRYTLNELQELWLDELPNWYKRKKGRKQLGKVTKLHNVYALNTNRLLDFEKIQSDLNDRGITDLRARLCFLYRNYVLVREKYQKGELSEEDFEKAEDEMLKFNAKFNYPMREHVIESATRVVNYRQYLYKNETLLNFLELDWEEAESLELQSIFKPKTPEEWNKEYYINSLKKKDKLTKQEEVTERREKIKDLLQKGLKQKDICCTLKISKRTYVRDRNYLKEQGLI